MRLRLQVRGWNYRNFCRVGVRDGTLHLHSATHYFVRRSRGLPQRGAIPRIFAPARLAPEEN
jgi:hypothetical protein